LQNLQGAAGLALPFQPGGAQNLYIEDSTFVGTGSNGIAVLDTAYSGGRIVFRHNTLTNSILYSHWTNANTANSLWWEAYNNKSTWTLGGGSGGMYPARMQGGGTGLIYNNTIVGFPSYFVVLGDGRLSDQGQSGAPNNYCNGTMSVDGNAGDASAPGWPCLAQTGRDAGVSISQIIAGTKPGSFPMYLWNNGTQDACSTGGAGCTNSLTINTYSPMAASYIKSTPHVTSGFGNGDVDFSITASQPAGAGTHRLNYTPFTYPYPLLSNGMPNVSGGGTTPPPPPPTPTPTPTPPPPTPTPTPPPPTPTPTPTPPPPTPTPTPPPPSGTTLTLGNTAIGGSTDSGDIGFINATKFTTGASGGTAQSMSVHVGTPVGGAGSNSYQLGIYADSGGAPGALVAHTASGTLTANAWNTLAISATLSANTSYWLGYEANGSGAQNNMNYGSGVAGQSVWGSAVAFGTWPASFGAIGGNDSAQFSIYVTYITP
jgi:hypothetical protein